MVFLFVRESIPEAIPFLFGACHLAPELFLGKIILLPSFEPSNFGSENVSVSLLSESTRRNLLLRRDSGIYTLSAQLLTFCKKES